MGTNKFSSHNNTLMYGVGGVDQENFHGKQEEEEVVPDTISAGGDESDNIADQASQNSILNTSQNTAQEVAPAPTATKQMAMVAPTNNSTNTTSRPKPGYHHRKNSNNSFNNPVNVGMPVQAMAS